jgi:dimethylglycine dehydrogenase
VRGLARAWGLEFELLSPADIRSAILHQLHDLVGGLWDPFVAISISQLAGLCGAPRHGREIVITVSPAGAHQGGRMVGEDRQGRPAVRHQCRRLSRGRDHEMVSQYMPIISMSHQYLVTGRLPSWRAKGLPLLAIPMAGICGRAAACCRALEWKATPHWLDRIPDDFANQLWPDDLERLEKYIDDAIKRVPILGKGGVQRVINGPIPYSPDGNPYIGPAHGLPNFYQCCCFSFGIAQAGGGGKSIAEWIVHGEPEWDFWVFDPRRYTDYATKK